MQKRRFCEAVVIGCNYASVLGIVKSVGEAGYRCGLIHHTSNVNKKRLTPDMASGYVYKRKYVEMKNDRAMLKGLMEGFRVKGYKPVLLPADDYSASFADRYYEKLKPWFRVMRWEGEPGRLTYYMDKEHQKEIAQMSGFKTAINRSVQIPDKDCPVILPEGIVYPCITKPEESAGCGMSKAVIAVCSNEEELKAYFSNLAQDGMEGRILVEEFLTIEEEFTVPGLRLEEEIIIPAFVRKLMTGTGKVRGVTVMGITEKNEKYPELVEQISCLVKNLGLMGFFDVEIIKSKGEYYFNEINLRSSAATYGITGAGVNLPGIFVDYMLGKEWKRTSFRAKAGIRYMNEKPGLQCCVQKDLSVKGYYKLCRKANVRLLTGPGDRSSRRAFRLIECKNMVKRLVGPGAYGLMKKVYHGPRSVKRMIFDRLYRRVK